MTHPPALLFGVPLADLTMDETLDALAELVEDGRRTGRTHQVTTVNVDFLVNALADDRVMAILQGADLNLVDGMPVAWGPRLLGMSVRERVAGSDLVPLLVERSAATGHHVHFFGSMPEVAAQAERVLRERYPAARFSIDPGPMLPDPRQVDAAVIESIRSFGADIVCVALGNPKQEHFIDANRDRLGVPVMIGVGGSLDMLVGHRRRAPRWVQTVGLEWVFRALQEPARLGRRYGNDLRVFLPTFGRTMWGHRRRRGGMGLTVSVAADRVVARLGDEAMSDEAWDRAVEHLLGGAPLDIDAGTGRQVTDAAAARLVGLVRAARRGGGSVSWITDPDALSACLRDQLRLAPWQLALDDHWRRS